MYRPGGFPEYSPKEQKVFDGLKSILTKHFEQRNYEHVLTPSVESVDILSRGGDIFDKQVYGLYGLAQGPEDTKNYALHFDLTIPFARYTLDHLNELTFPFKRYQMQPVWRGERTKRGRYKEFWQFDIDTIRRSGTDVGTWCDAESIIVMYKALQEVFAWANIDKKIVVKVSNVQIAKSIVAKRGVDESNVKGLRKTLDDRYKRSGEENIVLLKKFLSDEQAAHISAIIDMKDIAMVAEYEGSSSLKEILTALTNFGVNAEFALPIVRGHAYYTGTVVEFFIEDDMELGAIAGGGAYDKLTDFIDAKNSFSGVGCSLSSRIMEILLTLGKFDAIQKQKTFLIVHFPGMFEDGCKIMEAIHRAGFPADIYPTPEKLSKQIQYADKKGLTRVVIYGESEKAAGEFKVKHLTTGEERVYKIDEPVE